MALGWDGGAGVGRRLVGVVALVCRLACSDMMCVFMICSRAGTEASVTMIQEVACCHLQWRSQYGADSGRLGIVLFRVCLREGTHAAIESPLCAPTLMRWCYWASRLLRLLLHRLQALFCRYMQLLSYFSDAAAVLLFRGLSACCPSAPVFEELSCCCDDGQILWSDA